MYARNHPYVVWTACVMWFLSLLAIGWSLTIFLLFGDALILTRTDLITAVVLLSGIVLLPTHIYIIYTIANGCQVRPSAKVYCCALWTCISWIILIDTIGAILCLQKLYNCALATNAVVLDSLQHYRSGPRYKRFIDNVQWSLNCCGVSSYKDWFHYDWHDKLRDYEWYPPFHKTNRAQKHVPVTDSVPLSCCKSGSCMPDFLLELGTHSIHTRGCGPVLQRIAILSINIHLIYFLVVTITHIFLLHVLSAGCCKVEKTPDSRCGAMRIKHIMPLNTKFNTSSGSIETTSDDNNDDADQNNSVPLNVAYYE